MEENPNHLRQDSSPTEIDSCTVIDEPGEYELVADLEPEQVVAPVNVDLGCIKISRNVDDVTIYGNGHTIDGHAAQNNDAEGYRGYGIGASVDIDPTEGDGSENIVIEDVTITGFKTGVRFDAVFNSRISNVVARDNEEGVGFYYFPVGNEIENNRLIENGAGFKTYSTPVVTAGPGNNTFEYNDIESNGTGIFLDHEFDFGPHTFRFNRIVGNGNGVTHTAVFTEEATYHHNAICGNAFYGIRNQSNVNADPTEDAVNATENYWGAADGPSSFGDPAEPFTDHATDAPADGDGDAISQSLEPGVANVHFDPFLEAFPQDAGADL